jgi:hypothetical protein
MFSRTPVTRRSVLAGIGAVIAVGGGSGRVGAESEWTVAETETDSSLHDVRGTATVPHAVGDGGVLIRRSPDRWEVVFDGGPSGNGNDLYGVDVTDDGERLWVVGASGAIGEYDVTTGNLVDRSTPMDSTNNYNDVAVTGLAGDADVYVAGDSGKIYYSFENGKEGTWNDVTPGSGTGLPAIDFHRTRSGHAIDTNGRVFETDDGETWEPIGIEDADVTFYGLDSDGPADVTVVGGNGTVFRYDGAEWRTESVGDTDLMDVTYESGEGITVGSGGDLYEASADTWMKRDTPTGENLLGTVASFDAFVVRDYAVGAGGIVLER